MRGIAFSRLLMFVVLVPLIALTIFGGRLTYDSWSRYNELGGAISVLRLSLAAAQLGGLGIPGEAVASREFAFGDHDRAKLDAQHRRLDDFYREVREAGAALKVEAPGVQAQLEALAERMRGIDALRAKLEANSLKSATEVTEAVSPVSGGAIAMVGSTSAIVNDTDLSRAIFGLYASLQFSESALSQRGAGEVALREGKLATPMLVRFARSSGNNATFNPLFHDYAPAELVRQFDTFDAANGRELDELRRVILANSGQPASEAQQRRWAELSREITAVSGKMLNAIIGIVRDQGGQALSAARRGFFIYLMFTLAVLAVVILLSRQMVRILRELLGQLAGAVDKMRDGNYEVAIPHVTRDDEIGIIARAVDGFRENFVRVAQQDNERKNAEAAAERKSILGRLAGDFEAVIGNIVGAVSSASGELTSTATALTRTAETTQQLSTTVVSASESASSNVQSVASATEEMGSSISEIGRQVQESSRISGEAVSQAQKTDERITKLAQAAARIGDVTQLITSIAEQTNLLALNATIEAARAGVAGKGFAVVAQEVKQLAEQTAKATSEISTQIAEMQAATQDSVAAIKEIGGTIGRISEIATSIASAVEQQGAATQEITRNIQQAAAGTVQVANNISEVSEGAAKTGVASSAVLASAKSLADQSGRLKTEVDKFLATVRAA